MNILTKFKDECEIVKHNYFFAYAITSILSHLFINPKIDSINYILVFFIILFFLWKSDVGISSTPLHFVLFLVILFGSQYLPYIG